LPLEIATAKPPVAAFWESVTVQFEAPPESTVVGVHCSEDTSTGGGVMVTDAEVELPFNAAVTLAV
jgi:hypothetical protein